MAAGGDTFSTKIHSSLVSSYPKPFDIRHDVFVPGSSTKFRQQLRAALSTRGLLRHLEETAPTAQKIATANPAASGAEVLEALQEALDIRQQSHNTAAAQLPETLKSESLNLQERTALARHGEQNDAVALYEFIMQATDIQSPKVVQHTMTGGYRLSGTRR